MPLPCGVLIRRQRLAAFRRMTSCIRLAKAVAELHRALVKDRVAATSPGPMCVLWVAAHSTCVGRRPSAPRGDHRTAHALVAIEWPGSELRVFATLRGPLFALGDEALLAFRQQAPFLRHSSLPDLSVRSPSFQYVHDIPKPRRDASSRCRRGPQRLILACLAPESRDRAAQRCWAPQRRNVRASYKGVTHEYLNILSSKTS